MPLSSAALSASRRSKWLHVTMGVSLIVVAIALTVAWQYLGISWTHAARLSTLRWVVYFLGTVLFLLLIGGLVLIVILLLREVRLNERQSNFISAVTHELKTPVSSLKLYLDTLRLRELPDSQRLEFYRTMSEDLDRLNTTINNVLNAAMYTDRPIIQAEPLDLAQVARHCIELTRTRNRLPPETITYEGPEELTIRGETAGLEAVVLNLLDNAVKYSGGAVLVEVAVGAAPDGQAYLRVRDHGIGMSRHHLRFIFNRFYRIGREVRRSHAGTGLGLYIVRSVVRRHHGSVSAESPGPNAGTTITVTLPGVVPSPEGQALETYG